MQNDDLSLKCLAIVTGLLSKHLLHQSTDNEFIFFSHVSRFTVR